MHASVRHYFVKFNEPIEARIPYMYLDIKGLVTVGVGNLIDVERPSDTANLQKILDELVKLPFIHKKTQRDAGKRASAAEILAEWKKVKNEQALATRRDGVQQFANITALELPSETIETLALKKADAMERELKRDTAFLRFDQWPADGQLGLLSMAWALGAPKIKASWPRFKAACREEDFDGALKHCEISTVGNPGVAKRNTENRRLFKNAATVIANEGGNASHNLIARRVLHYPSVAMRRAVVGRA